MANKFADYFEQKINKMRPVPSPFLIILHKQMIKYTVSINHDFKALFGLIQDGLFTSWKFGIFVLFCFVLFFSFHPRLHDLQLLVLVREPIAPDLCFSTMYSSSSNKPPPPLPNVFDIN